MPAGIIMLIGLALTMAPLLAVVAFIANAIAFENGHYDHERMQPRVAPWNPEFHVQLHGREHS